MILRNISLNSTRFKKHQMATMRFKYRQKMIIWRNQQEQQNLQLKLLALWTRGLLRIQGVFGKERTAASSIASAPTPNWMPKPIKAPSVKSTPKADTKAPSTVICPLSSGSDMKLALWRLLYDLSIVDRSGGSRQSIKAGVVASFRISFSMRITLSRGICMCRKEPGWVLARRN